MSPSRIIASAGCKNFAAFGGVAVNRPAVHGSIVRDGGDIVGVRVIELGPLNGARESANHLQKAARRTLC